MAKRLSDGEFERVIGCTPCLCGDIGTWHDRCYRGKTQEQITQSYKRAFRIARERWQTRVAEQTNTAIDKAARGESNA